MACISDLSIKISPVLGILIFTNSLLLWGWYSVYFVFQVFARKTDNINIVTTDLNPAITQKIQVKPQFYFYNG